MIGEQDLDAMELQIGRGHVVYTGAAKGTDEFVEQMAKQFGMQVEVLVPPQSSSSLLHHTLHRGSPHAGQPASSPGGSETGETDAQSFLHASIAATQLSNCLQSAYHLCFWHLGKGWQTRERGHGLDRAISHGSRQTSLPL